MTYFTCNRCGSSKIAKYSIPNDHRVVNRCLDCMHGWVDVRNLRVFPITYMRYRAYGGNIMDHWNDEYCEEVGIRDRPILP